MTLAHYRVDTRTDEIQVQDPATGTWSAARGIDVYSELVRTRHEVVVLKQTLNKLGKDIQSVIRDIEFGGL